MSCPTCDHTLHKVGVMPEPYTGVPLFWCPRCGTLKANVVQDDDVPQLVGRVIEFGGLLTEPRHDDLIAAFERLGVRESICPDGTV